MEFKNVEENNKQINKRGFVGYEGEFAISFRNSKRTFFSIRYGKLGHLSQDPYFVTSAEELNRNRDDYDICGQAQEILTNEKLLNFFNKWDKFHLKILTLDKYEELIEDIENLKENVPYIEGESFADIVEFDRKLN